MTPPVNPKYFCSQVELVIGHVEGGPGDNFSCTVCTPSWFADYMLGEMRHTPTHGAFQHPTEFGRHYLFVNDFNEKAILSVIENWVTKQEADSWLELANRLTRHLQWEYEDYKEA